MKQKISIFLFSAFLLLLAAGCQKEDPQSPESASTANKPVNSCEGCHTNYEVLKAIYTPDTDTGGGAGCGGETPHFEPYDRVFLGGEGYAAFKKTMHGRLDCTDCHNGVDDTDDKKLAHSGDFIKHPSQQADVKCVNCHGDIVSRTHNSIHEQGWGQKAMVVGRSGLHSFAELTEKMKEGYDTNCGKCHATCGDCHVNRPKAGGGGLLNGHNFAKQPSMRDNCITCHVSRGGHAFLGIAMGTVPDVHQSKAGFECMSCHTQNEIHGDGNVYDQRYKMALMPKCTNCHQNLDYSNKYHSQHMNLFSCNTCHSQDYNNCGSCHIGGEGARVSSYQGFKIGMNPIPQTRNFKMALLRRSLMAPDSWSLYGTSVLTNFDSKPTYKYTTPHNIIKWTSRTDTTGGKACYESCHIIKEGDTYKNKELYLFESDLQQWEISADKGIVVDGKLPSSWGLNK